MTKILIGKKAICEYLKIGKSTLDKLITEGLPIDRGAGGLRTHIELLDDYFKKRIETASRNHKKN